ncbi:AAA family ATPase [Corallococcus llansteffanensis]|uniref:ATP-binding protein n=1 Tax=Corallococcus llansteffanensis TaxID=2316731 RepID=A0A3A8Q0V5_9BACT|nr:AAA family ATPase [Corallococcus llansteffanensis]RKH58452.1 ATP-binding protein [Corallococcus llansteffanensis]
MSTFISIEQVKRSLQRLSKVHTFFGTSFLAFKSIDLPVGRTSQAIFSQIADSILLKHYQPAQRYEGFYNPFKTSKGEQHWVKPRYASTTLQRITTDTFGKAFIHPRNSSEWGWQEDYIERLREKLDKEQPVPAFDLAVWLFREKEWPIGSTANDVRDHLFNEYNIRQPEIAALFDLELPAETDGWLRGDPITEQELLMLIGDPPNSTPAEGATLQSLEIDQVGLAKHFEYEAEERLNLITGDNSLGKTFLLECIWWALTGTWPEGQPMLPRAEAERDDPHIQCTIVASGRAPIHLDYEYAWEKGTWNPSSKRKALPGVVIYARFDGSFAVWDPVRQQKEETTGGGPPGEEGRPGMLFFHGNEVWDGLRRNDPYQRQMGWLCNGLIHDWLAWERGGPIHQRAFGAFMACIEALSPSEDQPLRPGKPRQLPFDSREFPTLLMPYGEVPVIHASAGIKRMLALSYIMVWSWSEYERNSELARRKPEPQMVLIVDEIEAHLHPRWQRVIVPALMSAVSKLASGVSPQIHLATHSPLVMASAEPLFDEQQDSLYHLKLDEEDPSHVVLERMEFNKHGSVDRWLTSDVFGLSSTRSREAERAISHANSLQRGEPAPTAETVREAHEELRRVLASDDVYWPRWRFFAVQHGVNE